MGQGPVSENRNPSKDDVRTTIDAFIDKRIKNQDTLIIANGLVEPYDDVPIQHFIRHAENHPQDFVNYFGCLLSTNADNLWVDHADGDGRKVLTTEQYRLESKCIEKDGGVAVGVNHTELMNIHSIFQTPTL